MAISSMVILIPLSLFAIYCMLGKNGRGARNYIIRTTIGIYVLVLGTLSILKSNTGLQEAIYFGVAAVVLSILSLFVFKNDYEKCKIINVIGVILGTIATFLSYIT